MPCPECPRNGRVALHLEKMALVVRQWERRLQGIERSSNTWTSVAEELLKDLEFSHLQLLSSKEFSASLAEVWDNPIFSSHSLVRSWA